MLRRKLMEKENVQQTGGELPQENPYEALERFVSQYLTPEAKQRLFNIKMAHPEKYLLALQVLYQILQRQPTKIDDTTLKKVLQKVFSQTRRETKIKFI